MPYSPPKYPTSIPTHLTDSDDLPPWYDDLTWWNAARANALRSELCAVMDTLGVLPQASFDTVSDRMTMLCSGYLGHLISDYEIDTDISDYITFNSTTSLDDYDDQDYHSPTSNPSYFYLPPGRHLIQTFFQINIPFGTPDFGIRLELNGAYFYIARIYPLEEYADETMTFTVTIPIALTSATSFRLYAINAGCYVSLKYPQSRISILNLGK